jgi:hypothetical protein
MTEDAPDVEGPYRCPCGCEVSRGDPATTVTASEFEQQRHRLEPTDPRRQP